MAKLVITTCPAEKTESIVRPLIEERLAACANIVAGVRSLYRWEGKIETSVEDLVLLKTRADLVESLGRRLRELHPYEVPEMIALPIESGLEAYLEWVDRVTR